MIIPFNGITSNSMHLVELEGQEKALHVPVYAGEHVCVLNFQQIEALRIFPALIYIPPEREAEIAAEEHPRSPLAPGLYEARDIQVIYPFYPTDQGIKRPDKSYTLAFQADVDLMLNLILEALGIRPEEMEEGK